MNKNKSKKILRRKMTTNIQQNRNIRTLTKKITIIIITNQSAIYRSITNNKTNIIFSSIRRFYLLGHMLVVAVTRNFSLTTSCMFTFGDVKLC